jgi:hypothetical protein
VINFIYEHRISQWVTVILWIVGLRFLHFYFFDIPSIETDSQRGLFHMIIHWINQNLWLSFTISTILIVAQGLILRYLCWEYAILDKSGYSVLFFYGNLSMLFNGHFLLHYVSLGSVFLLLGIWAFYRFLNGNYQRIYLFFAAFFMGISALAVPEFFWTLVFLVVMVMVFKASEAADVFVILFGFLMPYYLVSSLGYLFNTPLDFKQTLAIWNTNPLGGFAFSQKLGITELLILAVLILVAFFGAAKVFANYYRYNIEARRSRLAMGFFGLFITLIWLLNYQVLFEYFILFSIPLSIYTANAFQSEKRILLRNLIFYVYLATVIFYGFI